MSSICCRARSGPPGVSRKKTFPESHIILYWPSLFGQHGWILASFFFCELMDLDFVLVHKHAKKNLANIEPSLTSQLVNNPYTWYIMHGNAWQYIWPCEDWLLQFFGPRPNFPARNSSLQHTIYRKHNLTWDDTQWCEKNTKIYKRLYRKYYLVAYSDLTSQWAFALVTARKTKNLSSLYGDVENIT